jgi:hypothetical protein
MDLGGNQGEKIPRHDQPLSSDLEKFNLRYDMDNQMEDTAIY